MNLNDVKAGKYQLVAVRWDEIKSKPGEPLVFKRHRKGDIVELDEATAKRLVKAGAVVTPGQLEKNKAEQARALAERAAADYQAILAGLPEDVRAEIAPGTVPSDGTPPQGGTGSSGGTGGDGSGDGSGGGGQATQDGEKPSADANIPEIIAWVGNDRDRAAEFIESEEAREKPRTTLLEQLAKVLED